MGAKMNAKKILNSIFLKQKSIILVCAFLAPLGLIPNFAHAFNIPSSEAPSEVDKLAEEVKKINSLAEALAEKDKAEKTINFYNTALRQLLKDIDHQSPRELAANEQSLKNIIQEQRRKIKLLDERIVELQAVEALFEE